MAENPPVPPLWAETTTSYPVGSDPWALTPTCVAPAGDAFVPGTPVTAEAMNYQLRAIGRSIRDIVKRYPEDFIITPGAGSIDIPDNISWVQVRMGGGGGGGGGGMSGSTASPTDFARGGGGGAAGHETVEVIPVTPGGTLDYVIGAGGGGGIGGASPSGGVTGTSTTCLGGAIIALGGRGGRGTTLITDPATDPSRPAGGRRSPPGTGLVDANWVAPESCGGAGGTFSVLAPAGDGGECANKVGASAGSGGTILAGAYVPGGGGGGGGRQLGGNGGTGGAGGTSTNAGTGGAGSAGTDASAGFGGGGGGGGGGGSGSVAGGAGGNGGAGGCGYIQIVFLQ